MNAIANPPAENQVTKPLAYAADHSCSDYGDGPSFLAIEICESFTKQLLELQALCVSHKLSEVRAYADPAFWGPGDIENELRLHLGELVVDQHNFWFTARPKHQDYSVECDALSISEFISTVSTGEGPFYLGHSPSGLQEIVEQSNEDLED